MIVISGILIGALAGTLQARRKGGNRLDLWQYAGVYAIIGAVLGMFLTIAIDRLV